jgi:hypothetical protein
MRKVFSTGMKKILLKIDKITIEIDIMIKVYNEEYYNSKIKRFINLKLSII